MTNAAMLKSIWQHMSSLGEATARLIFPPQCAVCEVYLGGRTSFCERCAHALFRLEGARCPICGETREAHPGAYLSDDAPCERCLQKRPKFERARAFWEYSGSVADAIQRAKYGQRLWIVRNLALALGPWFRDEVEGIVAELHAEARGERPAPLLMSYVPMHPRDLRARGYNFPSLLLRACLKAAGYRPAVATLLQKSRQTRSQAGLPHLDRQLNLRGAFRCNPRAKLAGRTVLIFDDVLTTGATANEVSKTLRDAGATRVYVLSAARALKF